MPACGANAGQRRAGIRHEAPGAATMRCHAPPAACRHREASRAPRAQSCRALATMAPAPSWRRQPAACHPGGSVASAAAAFVRGGGACGGGGGGGGGGGSGGSVSMARARTRRSQRIKPTATRTELCTFCACFLMPNLCVHRLGFSTQRCFDDLGRNCMCGSPYITVLVVHVCS